MSNFNKTVKKSITKATLNKKLQLKHVEDWWLMYGHRYPHTSEASPSPAESVLAMMEEFKLSVTQAATAAEDYAKHWLEENNGG